MDVNATAIEVSLDSTPIVKGVTLVVRSGEIAGIVGPNGSGKSTLLRTLYRHLRPRAGDIVVGEDDLWKLTAKAAARRVAAVPQERPTEFDFTVWEMVEMGCIPNAGVFSSRSADTRDAVRHAMEQVGIGSLADRSFATLSGGERQRVLVARALVQATPIVVLDEPTNHLDIRHQLELLELIRALEVTTLMAIHDLNLAAAYCDSVHVMQDGVLVASGATHDVITPELVSGVFGVDCDTTFDPRGTLRLSFRPRSTESGDSA
jgi:iron complex transport system ATP-binding protein